MCSRQLVTLFLILLLVVALWFLSVQIECLLRIVLVPYWQFWLDHFNVLCTVVAAVTTLFLVRVYPNLQNHGPVVPTLGDCPYHAQFCPGLRQRSEFFVAWS